MKRPGHTFHEILTVTAIIGFLVALLLPAIQAAREAARRTVCVSNLEQLILGVQNYHMAHNCYPPGTIAKKGPILSQPSGYHHNWITQILPHLEERNAWNHVDFSVGAYHANNAPVYDLTMSVLVCPSNYAGRTGRSTYSGVHHHVEAPIDVDNTGVFILNKSVRDHEVADGLSQTLFIGETPGDPNALGWMSGTRATLRNMGAPLNALQPTFGGAPPTTSDPRYVGGFGSQHPGGCIFALGDGSVRFLPETMNPQVCADLAHRADGKLMGEW